MLATGNHSCVFGGCSLLLRIMAKGKRPQVAVRVRKPIKRNISFRQKQKFLISLIISLSILVAGLIYYDWMSADLPSLQQLENFNPNLVSRVYSADSVLIHEFFAERRVLVPLDEIPVDVINAFIST